MRTKADPPPAAHARVAGLTLIELLVVLTVLAALTTVALRATEGTLQQSRYDKTVRQLEELEDAVTGPRGVREPYGVPRISGFVADIGRLPRVVDVGDGDAVELQLEELWLRPADVEPFAIRRYDPEDPDAFDTDVRLGSGWRGPYLRMPPGTRRLRDGWGEAFVYYDEAGFEIETPEAGGTRVGFVESPGAGQRAAPYDVDLGVALDAGPYEVTFLITVERPDGDETTGTVVAALFQPDPDTGELTHDPQEATPTGDPDLFEATFDSTIGPRVVRAYMGEITTGDVNSAAYRSPPVPIVVPPGGAANIPVTLRPVQPEE